jgi:hypothetical protein
MSKQHVDRRLPGLPYSDGTPKLFNTVPGVRDSGWRFAPDKEGNPTPEEKEASDLAVLQKWADEQTQGLRTNRDTILAEKREAERKAQELADTWKGLDPAKVRTILAKFDGDEEMKLIAEGKFDEVINRRTEHLRKGLEAERDAARGKIDELSGKLGQKTDRIKSLVIDSQVRELGLAMDPPVDARGMGDAIRAARDIFTLNDDDAPVAKRPDGSPIIGKDGKSPLSVVEWLQATFEGGKTLWWGSSSGGGSTGGAGGGNKKKTDADIEKLSPRQKLSLGLAMASE